MDGSVRSGGVIKKKSSSGCLIIKKKGGGGGDNYSNSNWGGGRGVLSVHNEERKRPRVVESDSESSDEDEDEDESLEFMRRKVNDKRLHNGSMGHKRSGEVGSKDYRRSNVGVEIGGERKRSRLDLYEFDEYDEFDGNQMRSEYVEDRYRMVGRLGGRDMQEFGVSSSGRNLVVDKRKQGSYPDGSSSGRNKRIEYGGLGNKGLDLVEDDADMPISVLRLKYKETATEPIRVQGKNGVLKVMVNKNKKMDSSSQHKNIVPREVEERKLSRPKDIQGKDFLGRSPVNPTGAKHPEKRGLDVGKEKSVVKEKQKEVNLEKVKLSSKGSKVVDSEKDAAPPLKLTKPGIQVYSSKKAMKRVEEASIPPENVTPVKAKEGKAKRGGSTEKQILREKIRGMLVDAGWTIDYRPRRNRDYLDAVYINPNGTAYWSIIKAYDAFKKQLGEDTDKTNLDLGSPSVAPLSDDLINKLTRQTKKKIEAEMKRKRKEAGMAKSVKKFDVKEAADSSESDQDEERLSSYKKQNHKTQKRSLHDDRESEDGSSDDSPKRKPRKTRDEKISNASSSNVVQGRTSKKIGRCTLLVRSTDRGDNSESDGYVPYSGKRTVLAWLIDTGTAQLSEKVQYMNRKRTRAMLEGWITRDGIHCRCCSKILTVSKFELHAGSKLRQPFQNIYLESGASLLQCQVDAWNRQDESMRQDSHMVDVNGDDPDDDTCAICGDGGDLICCDSCPSTFHQICLGIQMLPSGDWHCPNCTCKFCGDPSRNDAEANDSIVNELIKCSFCENKYHKSCCEEVYMSSNGVSFCGLECQELYDHVQKILGVKHELEAGFSWSLNQRSDVSDSSLRSFHQKVECNSKLAVALSVMDECFMPITDRRSGINMMHNVVYNCGSNFNRLNYCGFYTAILERGDEIISAASIRIHGTRLAEMPFIGTREIYRRQGMCRRLFAAIETELCSLKVRQLIIPAIPEHMNTWTTAFGFHQLDDALKKEIKAMSMLVFPGTDMLQKQLVKQESLDVLGMKVPAPIKNEPQMHVPVEESDNSSPVEQNNQVTNNSKPCHDIKSEDNASALELSAFQAPGKEITIPVKPKVENKEKEHSASLKSPQSSDEGNNTCTVENVLLSPTAEDKINSSADVVMVDVCKIGAPSSGESLNAAKESANIKSNEGSLFKVSEDVSPQLTENTASVESPPVSVFETSAKSTTDNTCSGENVLLSPTAEDNINSSADVVMVDACKSESPFSCNPFNAAKSESANIKSNEGSLFKVSEGVSPQITENSASVESASASVIESSAKSTTDIVYAELTVPLSFTSVGVEEPSLQVETGVSQPTGTVVDDDVAPQIYVNTPVESPHASIIETSAKSATGIVNGELAASLRFTAVEIEEPSLQLETCASQPTGTVTESEINSSLEPSLDSSKVSLEDYVEATNGNQNPTPHIMDTSLDVEKSSTASNTEFDQKVVIQVENGFSDCAKPDEPNGESKIPLDDGKVVSPISCSEALAHDTETTEIHSNGCPDSNSAQP